jgi:hypothetical protein
MADETMSREDHERAYGPGHYRGAEAAEVCSADVVLRGEHIEELIAAIRAAAAGPWHGGTVRLIVDTTGLDGPCITVWAGEDNCVAEVPVAGVVFE